MTRAVAPAGSQAADIFAAERARKVATEPPSLAAAAPRTYLWNVQRVERNEFAVALPTRPGRYTLSVLTMSDDGDAGAASIGVTVQ